MFVVYYRNKSSGYFLRCDADGELDEPSCYGGTAQFSDATKFQTLKQARALSKAYFKRCRAEPDTAECIVLKQA